MSRVLTPEAQNSKLRAELCPDRTFLRHLGQQPSEHLSVSLPGEPVTCWAKGSNPKGSFTRLKHSSQGHREPQSRLSGGTDTRPLCKEHTEHPAQETDKVLASPQRMLSCSLNEKCPDQLIMYLNTWFPS